MHRIARTTGLFYLGLAITGGLGFLLIRPRLYAPGDSATTLANVLGNESLARAGVAVELLVVITQALAAWWFYRLFRKAEPAGAFGVAAFGLANAIMILGSAALLGTAVEMAAAGQADTVQLLFLMSDNLWGAGGIFFGLWLIPMGTCVLRSGLLPRPLGWVLLAGGAGYVLGTFLRYLAPGMTTAADLVVIPATIGEFWVIAYLLIKGVRTATS
jgi:hypothetical protein